MERQNQEEQVTLTSLGRKEHFINRPNQEIYKSTSARGNVIRYYESTGYRGGLERVQGDGERETKEEQKERWRDINFTACRNLFIEVIRLQITTGETRNKCNYLKAKKG